MDDWKKFTQAIIAGTKEGAPASTNQALADSFTGAFRTSAIADAGKAQSVTAERNAADDEREREAAVKAQIQKLQDQTDPSKYQKVRKDDGGFAFFDPSGKEIDIDKFAKMTGQRRIEVLADSENPLDQQFIDDYDQMNNLNQAIWRNDTEALTELRQAYPDLFGGGSSPTPEDINRRLLDKYPHIFGMGNYQKSLSNLGSPVFRINAGRSSGSGGQRSGLSL